VLLNAAFTDAVAAGLLQVNPATLIPKGQRPTHKVSRQAGKHWEPTEAARFVASTVDDRFHALWVLALNIGARRGELMALRWTDVDLDAGTVRISKNRIVVDRQVLEGTPKTGRIRRVELDSRTVTVLRAWRKQQLADRLAAGPGYVDSGYVFVDPTGEPVRPDAVTHPFRKACAAAGVPQIGVHGLRHTAATLMLYAGVPLHVVSECLGHANTGITADLYAHVLRGQQADAAKRLGDVLWGR
jgi:integrase